MGLASDSCRRKRVALVREERQRLALVEPRLVSDSCQRERVAWARVEHCLILDAAVFALWPTLWLLGGVAFWRAFESKR
jgi:hypothetical protein